MSIDFPQSPNDGQVYTFSNRTWTFSVAANAWIATTTNVGYTGSQGLIGFAGSSGAYAGMGYTGSRGNLGYTGSSGAYAAVGYTGSPGTGGGSSSVTVSTTAPVSPNNGDLWFAPTINTLSIYQTSTSSWSVVAESLTDDYGLITASVTVYDDYGSLT
jgi:hypothetical protein